jgi:hypothetical protein
MRTTRTIAFILAAIAMMMWTYVPVRAEYLGRLPKDQEFTVEVTNAASSTTAVTVYYLDRRGLDVVGVVTVVGTVPVQQTFPKPGNGVRRVIIEMDPSPGQQAQLRINQGAPITIENGLRLVFDVA